MLERVIYGLWNRLHKTISASANNTNSAIFNTVCVCVCIREKHISDTENKTI